MKKVLFACAMIASVMLCTAQVEYEKIENNISVLVENQDDVFEIAAIVDLEVREVTFTGSDVLVSVETIPDYPYLVNLKTTFKNCDYFYVDQIPILNSGLDTFKNNTELLTKSLKQKILNGTSGGEPASQARV